MSFYETIEAYRNFGFNTFCQSVTEHAVDAALSRSHLSAQDLLALLSDTADTRLETMARRASELTRNHFGNAVVLFTPMYISNYCDNVCPYCSFALQHDISRKQLDFAEIEVEAQRISSSGIRHILLLTGESPRMVTREYLEGAIQLLRRYFSSVAIEIFPLTNEEYAGAIAAGADTLTIYQETYNEKRYVQLHTKGPKKEYRFRLDAPERACMQGIRAVTVSALYGLYDWQSEAFFSALHAAYLQKKFPDVEVAVSFPRLCPLAGAFETPYMITNRQFVKMITAFRLFLPTVGITISTRESAAFRTAILPMGVTKMSAGVSTEVGGHSGEGSTAQFEIADTRDVATMRADLLSAGYQPVMHDWSSQLTA